MRILQIISGTQPNGAVLQCMAFIRELSRRGHRMTLVCRPNAWIADQMDGEIEIVESKLHRWPTDETKRISEMILRRGIDVIHTHMSRGHSFGVCVRMFSGVPVVASAHCRRLHPQWPLNDFVVAHSHATKRFMRNWRMVAEDRIDVIPYLMDFDQFDAVDIDSRRRIRESLGVSGDDRLIGIVGDVCKRKGHVHLVRAMPRILRSVPAAKLWIVGQEVRKYGQQVRELAQRLGVTRQVVWSSYRKDIPEVMHAMDICVSASLEEPLGLTMPEAMAAGRPVVATRVGGLPENVSHGENGFLVPPARPRPMADAVTRILLDQELADRFGATGRQRVHASYCRDRDVLRMEQVLQHAVDCSQRKSRSHHNTSPVTSPVTTAWPSVSQSAYTFRA